MKNLLNSDRRLSVLTILNHLNLPKTTVREMVIEHLEMKKVCTKSVSTVLTDK